MFLAASALATPIQTLKKADTMSTQSTPHCGVNTSVLTPEPLLELFGQCVRAGDLDGLVALYAPDAVFIPSPGAPVLTGRDAIRNALAGLLGLKPTMNFKVRQTLMVGDTAKNSSSGR